MTLFRSHLRRFSTLFLGKSLGAASHDTLLQIIINILVIACQRQNSVPVVSDVA